MQSDVSLGYPRPIGAKSEFRHAPYTVRETCFHRRGHGLHRPGFDPAADRSRTFCPALARKGSEHKIPAGCTIQLGNALDATTFSAISCDTFIHLVGTPHPAPWKGEQFRSVDLPSLRASVTTAARDGVQHFIFLSVAQPAPVMRAYIQVRAECERIICDTGLHATVVRPWYVLGPGHWWPAFLKPVYWLAARIETNREGAQRLGLVRLDQVIRTLVWAVEHPTLETCALSVQQIVELSRVAPHM